jgi:DNA-binding IscR family transcriptional regulator
MLRLAAIFIMIELAPMARNDLYRLRFLAQFVGTSPSYLISLVHHISLS